MRLVRLFLLFPALATTLAAQQPTRPTMHVGEYDPRSTLVVPEHPTTRAKFPSTSSRVLS